MEIMDWLRKLGVVRVGTKSYRYTSARDMPPEAFMEDVYDAEKDLLFSKDFNKKRRTKICKKVIPNPNPQKRKA